jgi:hypothetical protein
VRRQLEKGAGQLTVGKIIASILLAVLIIVVLWLFVVAVVH